MLGKFAGFVDDKITLNREGINTVYDVDSNPNADIVVTINGVRASTADLRIGDDVILSGKPVVEIAATRPRFFVDPKTGARIPSDALPGSVSTPPISRAAAMSGTKHAPAKTVTETSKTVPSISTHI